MRTLFPSRDNKFAFQLANFYFTCSIMKLESRLDEPACLRGNPRYNLKLGVKLKPRISHNFALRSLSIFGEKKNFDFKLLTFWPNSIQNSSMASLTLWQLESSVLAKSNKSSAKNKWEKAGPLAEALTSFHIHFEHLSSMILPSTSMHRMNRYRDNESPCWIPLDGRE